MLALGWRGVGGGGREEEEEDSGLEEGGEV